MAIAFGKPPAESLRALQNSLKELSQPGGKRFALENAASAPQNPHQIFSLGLNELVEGKGLESARPVSWRYFVGSKAAPTSAEIALAGGGQPHRLLQINSGPYTSGMLPVLEAAGQDDRVRNGKYECRLFRSNAIQVAALWLKATKGQDDLFVPLPPTIPELTAGSIYAREQFETIIREVARKKPKLDTSPQSSASEAAGTVTAG